MPYPTPPSTAPSGSASGDLGGSYPSPTVTLARGLKSATTTVSVSAATAPVAGQVLTATGDSAANWQTPVDPEEPPDWALYPGLHNGNFRVIAISVGTIRGTGNGVAYYGGRKVGGQKAANTTNGTLIAGVVPNSGTDAIMHTLAGSRWTIISIFRTPSSFDKMNNAWIGLSNGNLGDIDPTGAVPNYTAACHVAEVTGAVTLVAEDTGATQTASVGTLAVSTLYALKEWWDGTTLRAALATIDETTGVIGSYSTAATLTSGIPSIGGTAGGMYYQQGWVQGNTAAVAVEMHVGDVECWFAA